MIDVRQYLEQLPKFLVKAKKATYASETALILPNPERPHHKELEYSDGELYYRDSYTGSLQGSGMEEVRLGSREGPTLWTLAYFGGIVPDLFKGEINQDHKLFAKRIFKSLKVALNHVPENAPFRGPSELLVSESGLRYENRFDGDIRRFTGREKMLFDSHEVFTQDYIGGVIFGK